MRDVLAFIRKYGYAAAASLYLFTLGVFSIRHRPLISRICTHFNYRRPSPIPELDLRSIMADRGLVDLRAPVGVNGNISLLETLVLTRLVRQYKPKALFEIGTFNGRTTLNLAANAPEDARVTTLDLPPGGAPTRHRLAPVERAFVDKSEVGSLFKGSDVEPKITQLLGDSATFDFTPYKFRMDFVFVDGSHSEAYVRNDSEIALSLLNTEMGMILWHDYGTEGWEGVIRALDALFLKGGPYAGLKRIRGTSLVALFKT